MLKMLPNKLYQRLPKNWRLSALLDVSKILSSIIARLLDQQTRNVGLPEQTSFWSNQKTSDGTFALKIALQYRNANRHSHVVFGDLVKAFDSVNCEILFSKYGVPETLVIRKMYVNGKKSLSTHSQV